MGQIPGLVFVVFLHIPSPNSSRNVSGQFSTTEHPTLQQVHFASSGLMWEVKDEDDLEEHSSAAPARSPLLGPT